MRTAFIVVTMLFLAWTAGAGPAEDFEAFSRQVRDGALDKAQAQEALKKVNAALLQAFGAKAVDWPAVFPVVKDGPTAIGGRRGEGYSAWRYSFFDGNKHVGHPAQDIFIDDDDLDSRRDSTQQPAAALALWPGVVVGVTAGWEPSSELRGGNSVWVFTPPLQRYCAYAHLDQVAVKTGEVVRGGDPLGTVGRTGKNAAPKRSQTHLHLTCLDYDQGRMTPHNTYADLQHAREIFSADPLRAYPWLSPGQPIARRVQDIPAPEGFTRAEAPAGSFQAWLRALPLKKAGAPVLLHTGRAKPDPSSALAVIDIDTGKADLQQCADAVIRLRAEYLYQQGRLDAIHFNFVSGFTADYLSWRLGQRIKVKGDKASWVASAAPRDDHQSFREYLDQVFMFANTASLEKELQPVPALDEIQIGDVFIQGGFPGHAEIVVDLAQDQDGKRAFLLAQGFMPAQDLHLVKSGESFSPWFSGDFTGELKTPDWTFPAGSLRRFAESAH